MTEQMISGLWRETEGGSEYTGELHIDTTNSFIELRIVARVCEQTQRIMPLFSHFAETLCGVTLDGRKITLSHCVTVDMRQHPSLWLEDSIEQVIRARYAFWGINAYEAEEIAFSKAIVDYGDIVAWANLCCYRFSDSNVSGYSLDWVSDDPIEEICGDGVTITLVPVQHNAVMYSEKESVTLGQGVLLELEYDKLREWQAIMDDATCILQLISFAKREHVAIREIKYLVCSENDKEHPNEKEQQEFPRQYESAIFLSDGKETQSSLHPMQFLFTLDELNEVGGLVSWYENYAKLRPIVDLYLMAYSQKIATPEGYFLNLTQALEAFHARYIARDKKEYEERVRTMVESLRTESDKDYFNELLLSEGQKKSRNIFLRNRLIDLLYADGWRPFILNVEKCRLFAESVTATRNYYTHYSQDKMNMAFTRAELPGVNEMLMTILDYYIMRLIGFEMETARKKATSWIDSNWERQYIKGERG